MELAGRGPQKYHYKGKIMRRDRTLRMGHINGEYLTKVVDTSQAV